MSDLDGNIREKFHNLAGHEQTEDDWEPIISIGTAAAKVGLSVSALRKYEKEGLLIYYRTGSGRRLLSRADMRRINMIQHMINNIGLNMEGIRRLLALLPCWELKPCTCEKKDKCRAVMDYVKPCWMVELSECRRGGEDCRCCNVYRFGAYCAETMKSLLHEANPSIAKNRDDEH
jgi:MerR family transcriptional regulator/heat shock protein HspR